MFERFTGSFSLDPVDQRPGRPWPPPALSGLVGYQALMDRFAGCTFDRGRYRLHDARSGPQAAQSIADAWPEYADRTIPFGFDWLGDHLTVDLARRDNGEPLVLLLEPGTGEALEVPTTFVAFHDEELVDHPDSALADGFFRQWAATHPEQLPLQHDQCVGYRVPLFLGGVDGVENLEVTDLDVYWSLMGQLRLGVRDLSPGSAIEEVSPE